MSNPTNIQNHIHVSMLVSDTNARMYWGRDSSGVIGGRGVVRVSVFQAGYLPSQRHYYKPTARQCGKPRCLQPRQQILVGRLESAQVALQGSQPGKRVCPSVS